VAIHSIRWYILNGSCHTYESFMSRTRTSHVSVMSHRSSTMLYTVCSYHRGMPVEESHHTYEWGCALHPSHEGGATSHEGGVTNELCCTHESCGGVTSHIRMSCVLHTSHAFVASHGSSFTMIYTVGPNHITSHMWHTWISHVTHMNESHFSHT